MLTGCIDLDSQEGNAIQRFTKSADNSAPIRFPYCAWICLDSWVSFDLPLAFGTWAACRAHAESELEDLRCCPHALNP